MAPVRTFIRWLKGRSKDGHKAKIARLRQLPPVPSTGCDEYGFRQSERSDNLQHVYEEIPYEEIPANLRSSPSSCESQSSVAGLTDAMEQLDFSGAKTVGPYLVVPIRKGDKVVDPQMWETEEYRSLYSMFPEWAKQQLKDSARKRQGFAISRGYSVDPPPSNHVDLLPSNQIVPNRHSNQVPSNDIHPSKVSPRSQETPTLLEKSHDSGHGSDSDSDGYLRSVSGGNCRSRSGDSRETGRVSNAESLSDLEVFADEFDDDVEYFVVETGTQQRVPMTTSNVGLTSVPRMGTALRPKDRHTVARRDEKLPRETNSTQPLRTTGKYHIEAEALIDQLYQSSQQSKRTTNPTDLLPQRSKQQQQQQQHSTSHAKTDKSTGLSMTSLRSRDDITVTGSASNRMSCRTSDFQLDRHRRRSMDFRTKSRNSSTSSSGIDSDCGSVYGPSRGLDSQNNRFLGDMMRMNYDRQFMIPHNL